MLQGIPSNVRNAGILIALLLCQRFLSHRKQFYGMLLLPVLTLVGGVIYLNSLELGILSEAMIPFAILAVSLLVCGWLDYINYKKANKDREEDLL